MRCGIVATSTRFARRHAKCLKLHGWLAAVGCLATSIGCASATHAERGGVLGGLGGAGIGALVGNAMGAPGAGAAIGAGVGAISGASVGGAIDQAESRGREYTDGRLAQAIPAGSVSVDDVLSMSRGGVDPEVIATHVRTNGMRGTLSAQDLIFLKQQNVHPTVVQAMQASPPRPNAAAVAGPRGPNYVERYYYGGPCVPCWGPPPCGPGFGWGVSVGSGW